MHIYVYVHINVYIYNHMYIFFYIFIVAKWSVAGTSRPPSRWAVPRWARRHEDRRSIYASILAHIWQYIYTYTYIHTYIYIEYFSSTGCSS